MHDLVRRGTDLVCLAPGFLDAPALTALGLHAFTVPLPLPQAELAMAWHPRHGADGGHRWLRARVREAVAAFLGVADHRAGG
ncbi:hypothetical protein AB0D04_28260 [Streptomyces sp. NPDC048483]|uniref:hypothetical protein n=1 Tax=Streptomyces sp. NPDC048483 TaxID=3154927 RepID=UPI0034428E94